MSEVFGAGLAHPARRQAPVGALSEAQGRETVLGGSHLRQRNG